MSVELAQKSAAKSSEKITQSKVCNTVFILDALWCVFNFFEICPIQVDRAELEKKSAHFLEELKARKIAFEIF